MNNLLVLTQLDNLTQQKYHEIIRELERSGAGIPAGRSNHTAAVASNGSGMLLVDEFNTLDNFNEYHERWRSALAKNGLTMPRVTVYQVERKQHAPKAELVSSDSV
jgi:hypothetical protein